MILYISNLIVPITFLIIILFGYSKKVDVYDTFVEGAKEGIMTVFNILPTLIGLIVAVSVLRGSGALDILVWIISPITNLLGFPPEVVPLGFMRLVSSSAATGILLDIFNTYGVDSFIGRLSSTMMGCTETVFYTMSVYYMSVGIKKTRYTLSGAIIANIVGIAASFFIIVWLFGK